jgi:hypothetical protein
MTLVADEFNIQTGVHTKRISDWWSLSGDLTWVHNSNGIIGLKSMYTGAFTTTNYLPLSVIPGDGGSLQSLTSGTYPVDSCFINVNGVFINAANVRTGFSDPYTPLSAEMKAYFYGWKMANADGTSPYYKSEVPYTPSTWAEWGFVPYTGSYTADSTGATLIGGSGRGPVMMKSATVKASTKYGFLYNVVSSTLAAGSFFGTSTEFNWATLPKVVGNNSGVRTSVAAGGSSFNLYNQTDSDTGSIKLKDIRVFELPAGSAIEADFTNLTADQLAAKYTFNGLCVKNWKKITDGTGLTSTLPTASYSGYTPYKMIYQLATPVTTTYTVPAMKAFPGGKVAIEPVIKNSFTYSSGITVGAGKEIDYLISVYNTTTSTAIPLSNCNVASDGLSFTISSGASNTNSLEVVYYVRSALNVVPTSVDLDPVLMLPSNGGWTEVADYTNLITANGVSVSKSTTLRGSKAQIKVSYDIVTMAEAKFGTLPCGQTLAEKIVWIKANLGLSSVKSNATAYGTSAAGNKIYLTAWSNPSSIWNAFIMSNTAGSPTSIGYVFDIVSDYIDSNGFMHFLLHSNTSDGATPSVAYVDYLSMFLTFKTPKGYDLLVPATPRRDAGQSNLLLLEKQYATLTKDYVAKVAGSTTANPHTAYVPRNPSALMLPSGLQDKELSSDTTNTPITSTVVSQAVTSLPSSTPNQMMDAILAGRTAVNLVKNGDFSIGKINWFNFDSVVTVASNTATITGNGGQPYTSFGQFIVFASNHKMYYKYTARVTNSSCLYFRGRSHMTDYADINVYTPVANQWYTLSTSYVESGSGLGSLEFTEMYADAATQNGKVMEVRGVIMVDLTAMFGAGNEPDTATCDKLFPAYFEGVKSVGGDTITAINLVTNGNFPMGTTMSTVTGCTYTVANNTLTITGNGSNQFTIARMNTSIAGSSVSGKKFYMRTNVRTTNALGKTVWFELDGINGGTEVNIAQSNPAQNIWYTTSGIVTANSNYSGNIMFVFYSMYTNSSEANNAVIEFRNAVCIDLTALFGAGNEPDKIWCDRMFRNYVEGTGVFGSKILTARNLVNNGNFANGTTGWSPWSCTLTAANNILSATSDGSNSALSIAQNTSLVLSSGKKIYIKVNVKVTSSGAGVIQLLGYGTNPLSVIDSSNGYIITNPIENTWYPLSSILTVFAQTVNLRYYVNTGWATSAIANGKSIQMQQACSIDLTELFGAGNEPSKAQCDVIFKEWFDGSSNVTIGPAVKVVGKNLFDRSRIISGYYVSANGNLATQAGTNATDYIKVKPSTAYIRKYASTLAYYDINKTFIDYVTTAGFTAPSNVSYVRYGILDANLTGEQLEEAAVSTTYVPYTETVIALPQELKAIEY